MATEETFEGASYNEQLLSAARSDNEDLILEVLTQHEGKFDINFQDGLGMTALHYAAREGSTDVLEHILSCEGCDVDLQNRLDRATPLHLAVVIPHPELRKYVVDSLLEAGADRNIRDKKGYFAIDLIPPSDTATKNLFRKAQAQNSLSADDIASDGEDEGGSGSGSDAD